MIKHERPTWVKEFKRPKGTEIKFINNHWYLYERSTIYDPATKKPKKKSGKILGAITPQGFIPKGLKTQNPSEIEVKEFGATQYLYIMTASVRKQLNYYFPPGWKPLYVMAILRTMYGPRFKRLTSIYEGSMISLVFTKLVMPPYPLGAYLSELGNQKEAIIAFMKEFKHTNGKYILLEDKITLSSIQKERRSKHSPSKLLFLYRYDKDRCFPEYYKVYTGNKLNKGAYNDILQDYGIAVQDTVYVGEDPESETGFPSSLPYIFTEKRNNAYIRGKVPTDSAGYQQSFVFNGKKVSASAFHHDGFKVILYHYEELYADEMIGFISRAKKERSRNRTAQALASRKSSTPSPSGRIGTITLRTNQLSLNEMEVYSLYDSRLTIERHLREYDPVKNYMSGYLKSEASTNGWVFLNHLSLMMTFAALRDISSSKSDKPVSFDDFRQLLVSIRAGKLGNSWIPCRNPKQTRKNLENFGLHLEKVSLPISGGIVEASNKST